MSKVGRRVPDAPLLDAFECVPSDSVTEEKRSSQAAAAASRYEGVGGEGRAEACGRARCLARENEMVRFALAESMAFVACVACRRPGERVADGCEENETENENVIVLVIVIANANANANAMERGDAQLRRSRRAGLQNGRERRQEADK